eukprot:m.383796 g.383796  ORF g.383796 m.383796 type:complete len:70 (-) comp20984_c0_seq1:492-701(-)
MLFRLCPRACRTVRDVACASVVPLVSVSCVATATGGAGCGSGDGESRVSGSVLQHVVLGSGISTSMHLQ